MFALRAFLLTFLVCLAAYTAVTISRHGWTLFEVFFGDMAAMTWPGQFNFDFMGFLLLSGLWTAWRHRFSPVGLALGLVAIVGGMMFLTVYLLVMSFRAKDIPALLLGEARTA